MGPLSLTLLSGTCFILGVVLETWYERSRNPLSLYLAPRHGPSEPLSLYVVGLYVLVLAVLELLVIG